MEQEGVALPRLVKITAYAQKGDIGFVMEKAELVAAVGLKGDMHNGGERQTSILSLETREWMDSQKENGLCFKRFKENLLIEGIYEGLINVGSYLTIGNTKLKISLQSKHCFDECSLFSQSRPCMLADGAFFAVVERGGVIGVGDAVGIAQEGREYL